MWCVADTHRPATQHKSAQLAVRDALPVKGHTRPQIGRVHGTWSSSARPTPSDAMVKTLKVLQANMGKRPSEQHSLMKDEGLQDHGLLMITEPGCFALSIVRCAV